MLNWLRSLFPSGPLKFNYESVDELYMRCLNCKPMRIVRRDQLTFHAQTKHGFRPGSASVRRIDTRTSSRTKVVPL